MTRPRPSPRPTIILAAIAASATAAVGLAGAAVPAAAQSTLLASGSSASESTSAGVSQQPVVVVMDYSSSMLEADADAEGTTRLDAAKAATKELITNSPEDARLGLVTYGDNTPKDCSDISTLHEVGPVDAGQLNEQIDALDAVGETPIGAALEHAAADLEDEDGEKSIILVSDGEPNCNEPPACEAAESLATQGIDLTVHTIGFRIGNNSAARETLECIANATGGTHTDADDAEQLAEELSVVTSRAIQGYETAGDSVEGGPETDQGTALLPGQYVDTFERSGERQQRTSWETSGADGHLKYYSVPVPEGHVLNVAATLVSPRPDSDDAVLETIAITPPFRDGGPTTCYAAEPETASSDSALHPTASFRFQDEERPDACLADDRTLTFGVARTSDEPGTEPRDVELRVALEPIPEDSSGAGEIESSLDAEHPAPAGTDPTSVAGGGSFNDAPAVESGQTLSDTVVAGENRFYRVPAGYGQNLVLKSRFTQNPEHAEQVTVTAFNPVREQLSFSSASDGDSVQRDHLAVDASQDGENLGFLPDSIDNAYRWNQSHEYVQAASLSGDHYVVVSREFDPEAGDTELPFELTVDPAGEAQDGPELITTAAQYEESFGPVDGGTEQEPDAGASPDASEGTETEALDTEATSSDDEDRGTGPLPWILGGAGAVLVAGGALWLGLRRRNGTPKA